LNPQTARNKGLNSISMIDDGLKRGGKHRSKHSLLIGDKTLD
jgi:hypothetical protein